MAQMLVLNPRRKRRTRKTKAKATRRRRRRTVHAKRTHNPSRRRRYSARRRSVRRRRVHNPGLSGNTFARGAGIAGGAIVTEVLANKLAAMLPASLQANANVARIGTKAAIAIGVPMLLKRTKIVPSGIANAIAMGAAVATALDVLKTYVTPNIPGLSDYEQGTLMGAGDADQLEGYEQGTLMGPEAGAYGGGAY